MKYCKNCGAELPDDALYCPKCGQKQAEGAPYEAEKVERLTKNEDNLGQLAYIFMLICTIISGFAILPLCWTIPMTIHVSRCVNEGRKVGIGFAVCSLLFVSMIGGIFLLVREMDRE